MIKRYEPTNPNGTKVRFDLPQEYVMGTDITLFVNGQLVNSKDMPNHPYGYFLDPQDKVFTFYSAPYDDERLYVMYEIADLIDITFDNIDWDKKIRVIEFSNNIVEKNWTHNINKKIWDIKISKRVWYTKKTEVDWTETTNTIVWDVERCSI